MSHIPPARRKITRLRCVQECIKCFKQNLSMPESVCFVAKEVQYYCTQAKVTIKLYSEPQKNNKKAKELTLTPESILFVSGEECCNSHGKWLRVVKFRASPSSNVEILKEEYWYLMYGNKTSEDTPVIQIVPAKKHSPYLFSWDEIVEQHYALQLREHKSPLPEPDTVAVNLLRQSPPSWSFQHDEVLVLMMAQHMPSDNDHLGSIKNVVESLDVSTSCEDDGPMNLTDNDPDTYWESDGTQGQHWIQLRMKKGTIIKKLCITLCSNDDNYLPSKILVQGGEVDNLKTLGTITPDRINGKQDVVLLSGLTEHYPLIKIRFKECKSGGIDTRVRGIKITATGEKNHGFDIDFFTSENLIRFPLLQSYSKDQLYRRSQVIQRFMVLLDSVLQLLVPSWHTSTSSKNPLAGIRPLLPLSKKRMSLVDTCLKDSANEPPEKPTVYINRRIAMEHRCNPSNDPTCKSSVFIQLYDGLKPRERSAKPLDYRWTHRHDQWWECKFISEGIIDQGGGFRDSLSDLAEELCPSTVDSPIPLPYFIRAPNQEQEDGNVNTDVFIPNSTCTDKDKYIWIGQLMGACFRGRENLVLTLSSFVWKKLIGESLSWSRDYLTVDSMTTKLIDDLEKMDAVTFRSASRSWSLTLANGTTVILKMDESGNPLVLKYEDREEYCEKVKEARMKEFDDQITYIRSGLLQVIPPAVLDLLTWQEVESRVCGDPKISLEALKKSTHYDEVEETDERIKYMWEALKKFSNEDRSKFIKFVTGRRRLPASIFVTSGKSDAIDSLPESSTCANMLYLPFYSSAKLAEERIRYAIYNCVAIDTDMHPQDD
ncbi:E3 ubiquitin-protein ligase HECTD3 [Patella vulgata]|uniref:E3 ubiquitin-protein ligase HECTD3 n=1 Tax=Patella vulgata TaxID=6465 RepID=UPI0024A8CA99|nr:E3 ubiquitin-protein ligase HECTD3 [Patella vulgata]